MLRTRSRMMWLGKRGVEQRSLMTSPGYSFPWIHIVPQQQEWVIERFGRLHNIRGAGLLFTLPLVDKVAYVRGLMESTIIVSPQHAITKDNVQVVLDGVVYYQVIDTEKSSYKIANPDVAIANLAQSAMRQQVGQMVLDDLFHNRAMLNSSITRELADIQDRWGIQVNRYEIQDIATGQHTSTAMEKQSAAERNKRAVILDSEAYRQKQINESEGDRQQMINRAQGAAESVRIAAQAEAEQTRLVAEAHSDRIRMLALAEADAIRYQGEADRDSVLALAQVQHHEHGDDGSNLKIALKYTEELSKVLGGSKTVVVPNNPLDIRSIMAQIGAATQSV